jgi:uncharacterized SAM-dependent methyltransferase
MEEYCGQNCVLIEPGSGSSEKVRLLLDSLKPAAYVPMDISADFLKRDGGVLIGIDLHKSTRILEAAYNDEQGITALFNLNILSNINNITDANFNPGHFRHHAFYNEEKHRIEMYLVSTVDQVVELGDTKLRFTRGETIHTENSYKYTPESFQEIATAAGFAIRSSWSDEQNLFSVHYLELN